MGLVRLRWGYVSLVYLLRANRSVTFAAQKCARFACAARSADGSASIAARGIDSHRSECAIVGAWVRARARGRGKCRLKACFTHRGHRVLLRRRFVLFLL